MKRFHPFLLAFAVGIPGAGGGAELEPLGEKEFREQIVGNTFEGGYRARHFRFWVGANGVIRGQLGLSGSDHGVWRLDGDRFCYEWSHYFQGVERCYRWYRVGGGVVLKNADSFRIFDVYGRLIAGKPESY